MNTTTYSIITLFLCITLSGLGQDLEYGLKNSTQSAKPKTWMHAMSGNISKVFMVSYLEAIAATGQEENL